MKGIREAVALSASSVPDVVPSPSNEEGGQGQGVDGDDEGEGKTVYSMLSVVVYTCVLSTIYYHFIIIIIIIIIIHH